MELAVKVRDVEYAAARIESFVCITRVMRCNHHSNMIGGEVYLKMEQEQVSGSFKARGAYNKILSIDADIRRNAFFIAASTGNHAAAFCHSLKTLDLQGKVILPKSVSASKLEFIRSFGIPFELYGENSLHAEIYAGQLAESEGYVMVHPYSDKEIIAGQGTIGTELLNQIEKIDTIVVPVGGGGLIGGIATYVKALKPEIRVLGCQPQQSPEMVRSIELGHVIQDDITQPTLSDGTAGGMESDSLTFPICRDLVDEWHLIGEKEIAHKLKWMLEYHQILVEGAACLALATIERLADQLRGQTVVAIICGKRIDLTKVKKILNE